jgi:hypothetical protein
MCQTREEDLFKKGAIFFSFLNVGVYPTIEYVCPTFPLELTPRLRMVSSAFNRLASIAVLV